MSRGYKQCFVKAQKLIELVAKSKNQSIFSRFDCQRAKITVRKGPIYWGHYWFTTTLCSFYPKAMSWCNFIQTNRWWMRSFPNYTIRQAAPIIKHFEYENYPIAWEDLKLTWSQPFYKDMDNISDLDLFFSFFIILRNSHGLVVIVLYGCHFAFWVWKGSFRTMASVQVSFR